MIEFYFFMSGKLPQKVMVATTKITTFNFCFIFSTFSLIKHVIINSGTSISLLYDSSFIVLPY